MGSDYQRQNADPRAQLGVGPLWSDAWLPYDSYWLFDNSNSLSVGPGLTETNNQSGGANLSANSFGQPLTGFGSMGTVGNGSSAASYTLASGKQGQDVPLGHFVFRPGDGLFGTGTVLTNQGANAQFNFITPLDDPATFTTRTTLTVTPGQSVSQLFQAICPGPHLPPAVYNSPGLELARSHNLTRRLTNSRGTPRDQVSEPTTRPSLSTAFTAFQAPLH